MQLGAGAGFGDGAFGHGFYEAFFAADGACALWGVGCFFVKGPAAFGALEMAVGV